MDAARHTYSVSGHDHYAAPGDEESWGIGPFETCAEAIAAARRIIDNSLRHGFEQSRRDGRPASPADLFASWQGAGEGATLVTSDPHCSFDEYKYARGRAEEICRGE